MDLLDRAAARSDPATPPERTPRGADRDDTDSADVSGNLPSSFDTFSAE